MKGLPPHLIRGYILDSKVVFATHDLAERNGCLNFGGLRPMKAWPKNTFDHTMLVAEDDPELARFESLHQDRLVGLRVLPAVGCEATARYVFPYVSQFISGGPAAVSGSRASR